MKTIFKIILGIIALLIISAAIFFMPFPQSAPKNLKESELVYGYFLIKDVGSPIEIKIYNNGSVDLYTRIVSFGVKLSDSQAESINNFIDENRFSVRKESFYQKYRMSKCENCTKWLVLINKNGKTVNAGYDQDFYALLRSIVGMK